MRVRSQIVQLILSKSIENILEIVAPKNPLLAGKTRSLHLSVGLVGPIRCICFQKRQQRAALAGELLAR